MASTKQFFKNKWPVCDGIETERQINGVWGTHAAILTPPPFCDSGYTETHVVEAAVPFLCESAWNAKLEELCTEKKKISPTSHLFLSLFESFLSQF